MSLKSLSEARYGVHSLDHFALEVPSLNDAERFFAAFGLEVAREAGRLALRTEGDLRPWAYCHEGASKRLAYLSFNCYPEEYSGLIEQIRARKSAKAVLGGPYVTAEGRWFRDCDGNLYQIRVGQKRTPSAPMSLPPIIRAPGARGVAERRKVAPVQPSRLSHVMLFTSDVLRAVAFYQQALGLRVSDWSQDIVAFTHARHGSDHHLLAFVKSTAPGWHHSSWDVPSVREVGLGAAQMRDAGYKNGWGTAQHVLGSNYFHYVQDPWGSFAEYSADIDFIPAGMQWEARDYAPEDSLYLWGPDVPDYFVSNTET